MLTPRNKFLISGIVLSFAQMAVTGVIPSEIGLLSNLQCKATHQPLLLSVLSLIEEALIFFSSFLLSNSFYWNKQSLIWSHSK